MKKLNRLLKHKHLRQNCDLRVFKITSKTSYLNKQKWSILLSLKIRIKKLTKILNLNSLERHLKFDRES